MTTIVTFPSIPSAIFGSYISFTGKASATIKTGQIVISDPSSTGYYKPAPANGAFNGLMPAGVSASEVQVNEDFTIITSGIAYVGNSDDSVAIARGASVKVGAYAGAVALATAGDTVIGIALGEGIPANGYGRIKLSDVVLPPVIEPHIPADYIVFKAGLTYYAKDGALGTIVASAASCADVMTALVALLPAAYGGVIYSNISQEYINFRKRQVSSGDAAGTTADVPYIVFNRTTPGRMQLMWFHSEHRATPGKVTMDKLTFTIDGEATTVDLATLFGFANASSPPGERQVFEWRAKHMGGDWCGDAPAEEGEPNDCGGGWITFPINWKSTMKIEFTAKDSDSLIYWNIWWSDVQENDRTTKMSGRAYYTYPYLEIAPSETLTMVNTSGHPGRLLGVMLTQGALNFNFMPNDPTITVDGTALPSSGTEDFFLSSQYYWAAGPPDRSPLDVGPAIGILSRNYTYPSVSQYRDFLEEQEGIPFRSSLAFTWPNLYGGLTTMCGYWVIWEEY